MAPTSSLPDVHQALIDLITPLREAGGPSGKLRDPLLLGRARVPNRMGKCPTRCAPGSSSPGGRSIGS
eukprot:11375855-Alexandrium_andersonii.AAC.1